MKTIIKITSTIIVAIFIHFMTSCNDKDEPLDQPTIASRTILVYMVSNNSLGAYGYDSNNLTEMVQASLNSDFNNGRLIIYHAPYNNIPTLYEISNGKVTLLKEYDLSALSVDAQRMQEVINDTKRIAPANSYGLILWSHANGWLQTGITNKANTPTDFTNTLNKNYLAFGEDQGKHMNITSLAQVINDENFDFIYCDCCYMGSIEVAYELRNATPYIIYLPTECLMTTIYPSYLKTPLILRKYVLQPMIYTTANIVSIGHVQFH